MKIITNFEKGIVTFPATFPGDKIVILQICNKNHGLVETNEVSYVTTDADTAIDFLTKSDITKLDREQNFDMIIETALNILLIDNSQNVKNDIQSIVNNTNDVYDDIFLC